MAFAVFVESRPKVCTTIFSARRREPAASASAPLSNCAPASRSSNGNRFGLAAPLRPSSIARVLLSIATDLVSAAAAPLTIAPAAQAVSARTPHRVGKSAAPAPCPAAWCRAVAYVGVRSAEQKYPRREIEGLTLALPQQRVFATRCPSARGGIMGTAELAAKAEAFRALHRAPPLLLMANAWDAVTARLFEAEGYAAVATTSGGVSWAIGYPDGEAAPWDEVVSQTARIARAVKVPVTADIEAGFGATPEAVASSIKDIIGAGVVGVNLEDGTPGPTPIRPIDEAVARIRAAREAASAAGVPIVINARTDLYLRQIGDEASRFDEAVARGRAYLAAGADCVYPIALQD